MSKYNRFSFFNSNRHFVFSGGSVIGFHVHVVRIPSPGPLKWGQPWAPFQFGEASSGPLGLLVSKIS